MAKKIVFTCDKCETEVVSDDLPIGWIFVAINRTSGGGGTTSNEKGSFRHLCGKSCFVHLLPDIGMPRSIYLEGVR